MCDELGQRQYHDDYVAARPQRGDSRHYRVNRALEAAVMTPLMPLLDCLQSDGSLEMRAIPTQHVQIGNLSSDGIRILCMKAAAVIKAKFATPPLVCEKKYFTFPSKPDFVNQEYGAPLRELEGQARHTVFHGLMAMLENSAGPLSGDNLEILKSELRQNPDLLAMATNSDLWSLFHHAAAGPAHDADLVEWMIQLGALTIQLLHCRYELQRRELPFNSEGLPNTMAVHNAAIAGHEDIVRIILEADNMVDLNTPTYHTKETLAHLAVKHGHRSLYEMLLEVGADLRIKDGEGRRICDVTNDREWRREIAASIAEIERCEADNESKKNRDGLFRHQSDLRAERLRQSVIKKKQKKKKKKKCNATANVFTPIATVTADDLAEATNLLKDLLVPSSSDIDPNDDTKPAALREISDEDTAAMFGRLRDPNIPAADKTDDVQRACQLIKKLESLVTASSHPSRLNSTDRHDRVAIASEALQVIHLMQKLHRVNDPAIAVPALSSVRQLCATTLKFTSFVIGTAQLSVSVNRKPQAKEILDLLEKRLVKMPFDKREAPMYRELVHVLCSSGCDWFGPDF
ncbi:Ankyrin repeats domain-containing protein [Phytophthora infestans]|uniref:Ankyrin repeats domain-containing protein n=1 Tax=Phytophthora infestans TaxID=4787 RepID=A0A8S9UDC0_PHYIN|nr:Ankyrin repeats domain-containing protein [Phytophthora infestans]